MPALPMPTIDAQLGDEVQAMALVPKPTDSVMPGPVKDRVVTGRLACRYVEATGIWRFSVDGRSVSPSTIKKVSR